MKKHVNLTLDEEMIERLYAICNVENRSLSNLVNRILLQYFAVIDNKEEQP